MGTGLLVVLLLAACQTQTSAATTSASTSGRPSPTPTTPVAAGLGAAGCKPPSPATPARGGPEVRGTITGGELWTLLDGGSVPEPKGVQLKIVWRVTGHGDLHLSATGPAAQTVRPDWGPEAHGGSSWQRPGDEWGTGFTFPAAGCWDVHAARDNVAGDVYLMVA